MEKEKKKKKSKSVALKYENKDPSPKLVAKAEGLETKKLLSIASDNDIPIIKDDKLADTIYQLEINEYIPPELFEIVATIYSFVMKKKEMEDEKES